MLYYPDDTIQHAGVVLGMHGVAAHPYCGKPRGYPGQMGRARLTQAMSAVTAACLLVRRTVFDEAGGLDESLRIAFNDIDFCLRVRRLGYRNVWTPFAELYHHESATRGHEDSPEKQARFAGEVELMRRKWGDELAADPAYSPNLTLTGTPFELAFPPRGPR
jgi:GT2 family glycosyltransferase